MQSALLGQAYGAYVVLLREEFGWSRTLLSAASSLREAESGITSPVQGWLLDRFGPRNIARVGIATFGIGFMLFSQVQSPLTFYVAFLVMSIGASLGGYLTMTVATVSWFERKRSTALSMLSTGFAIGGMVVPATVLLMEQAGWRVTAFLSGVVIICVGLPLAQVLRASPEEMGLAPDGDPLDRFAQPGAKGMHVQRLPADDFTLREALREPSFWWLSLGHASALFVVSAMGVHLVAHLTQSQGYSLSQASTVVFAMTMLFLIGTVSGGLVGDRVNKRNLVIACMGMHATGLVVLSHAANVWMVLAFVLLHGLAWGWRGPQMAALRADYFGRSSFGKILGVSNLVILLGTISGPIIAGVLYDRTGNYRIGFDILAVMAASGSVFFLLARKPGPPVRPGYHPYAQGVE